MGVVNFDPDEWQQAAPHGEAAKVAKAARVAAGGDELSQVSQLSQGMVACERRAVAGMRRLADIPRPSSCDGAAWRQMLADARSLVDGGWGAKAFALGWREVDLFGIAKDQAGLVGLAAWLQGDDVTAISDLWAVVRLPDGGRRYFNRPVTGAVLPWEIGRE